MDNSRIFTMPFGKIYPLLVAKAEKKGRTAAEVDEVISWLTGYDKAAIAVAVGGDVSCAAFFDNAPQIHKNAPLIKGTVCGVRVEEIEDATLQKIRWLDKLVDELAKGKSMDKILRA